MVSKKLLLPIFLMACLFASSQSQAQNYSSTFLEYAYGFNNTDYITGTQAEGGAMHLITLDHTSVTKWGGVYGFVNYMVAPNGFHSNGFYAPIDAAESRESYRLYSEVSPWLSLGGITGQDFSFGPVADVSIDGQINFGNNFFAGLAGFGLTFKAPENGFLKLSTYWRTDNYNENTIQLTGVFDLPIWDKLGFRIQGFFDLIPQHQSQARPDGSYTNYGTDFLSQTRFLFDVGRNTVFKNDKFSKLEVGVDIYMHFNKNLAENNCTAFVPQPCVRLSF